jgi:type IX secretion system PorP/SprF family membrane protein
MKKLTLTLIVIMFCIRAIAQQDPMLSQYMFNGLFLNPAYAGSHRYFSSSMLYRTQWVGFDGAPRTSLFAIDGPIKNEKMGVGLIVAHDQIGVTRQTDVMGNYAYNIQLGKGKLAFGIKGGFGTYNAKVTDLTYWDKGDQIYANDIQSKFIPKFGFGTYYHTENWYAGFSIPTLLAYESGKDFKLDVEKSSFVRRHYLLTAGYVYSINELWKFKPSVLIKSVNNAPTEIDLNASIFYKDMIWFGCSYRSKDAVVLIAEYQANMQFRIGYAYDITLSRLNSYSNGTHEIMIGYDFGKDIIKVKTPRYF